MRRKINSKSFENQTFYVGIDVHKKSWKVTILSDAHEHKSFSMNPDPEILSAYLKSTFPGGNYISVYEAGFSGFSACRRMLELGIDARIVNASDVPTTHKERQQKTDLLDSRKLAKLLRNKAFEYIHIPDQELEADRTLVRQRCQLAKEVSRTKNRIKSILFQYNIKIPDEFTTSQSRSWSKPYLDWLTDLELEHPSLKQAINNTLEIGLILNQQVLKLNKQLRQLAKKDRYLTNYKLLLSIPGVGPLTAILLLTELGDINRFKTLDQLCSFIGLMPKMHSSGDRVVTGRMVNRGRKQLKVILIEAAWIAIRHDPALMLKYDELKLKMNGNKAIIRIARKLLARIKSVLLQQQLYQLGVLQ